MSFLKVFNKPHHSSTLSVRGLIHSVLATVVVAALAFIIKPFGLKTLESSELVNVVATLSGITLAMMFLAQFLFPILIKDFYHENTWTTGKQFAQLLIMSFLISLSTVFYLSQKSLAAFPLDAFILFGISIIPLGLLTVIQQNLLFGKFDKLATEKNLDLQRKSVVNSENPLNVLAFRGGGDKLNLIPNQLIYIKFGFRTDFYYQNMLGVEKISLAISRPSIIEELKGHPQFEVFGNDIIVNVNAIQKITGSARGFDLQIARVNELVKVSHKDKSKVEKL